MGKPTVTSLDMVPVVVRIHMHSRFKDTTVTFRGGGKAQPMGQGGRMESPDRVPQQRDKAGSLLREGRETHWENPGLQWRARTGCGGKAARWRSSKATSRRETHTIKDLVFPINFSPSDTALGKEQSCMILFSCAYSLAPSPLGWALNRSREERQNSRCWHNLCGPWRAEAAHEDQTCH